MVVGDKYTLYLCSMFSITYDLTFENDMLDIWKQRYFRNILFWKNSNPCRRWRVLHHTLLYWIVFFFLILFVKYVHRKAKNFIIFCFANIHFAIFVFSNICWVDKMHCWRAVYAKFIEFFTHSNIRSCILKHKMHYLWTCFHVIHTENSNIHFSIKYFQLC